MGHLIKHDYKSAVEPLSTGIKLSSENPELLSEFFGSSFIKPLSFVAKFKPFPTKCSFRPFVEIANSVAVTKFGTSSLLNSAK